MCISKQLELEPKHCDLRCECPVWYLNSGTKHPLSDVILHNPYNDVVYQCLKLDSQGYFLFVKMINMFHFEMFSFES